MILKRIDEIASGASVEEEEEGLRGEPWESSSAGTLGEKEGPTDNPEAAS